MLLNLVVSRMTAAMLSRTLIIIVLIILKKKFYPKYDRHLFSSGRVKIKNT